jgi:hypothetical protein
MRPTPLDRLRSAVTRTPAAEYALRRAHSRQLTELRDRESSLTARLQETIDGLVSFAGGFAGPGLSGWAVAGGAPTGTVNDRKGGRDVPLFQNEVQLRQYRILARWLCQTNDLAVGFLDLLTNFHLRAGFGWAATPRGARAPQAHDAAIDPGDVDPDAAAAQGVLDEFRAGDPLTPGTAWRSVAREGFRRLRRDGECFLRLFRGGPGTRGVPAARWVEPEQVGPPDGDTTGRGSFGVLSAAGDGARHLAYFVRDPDGDGQAGRWVRAAGARDHELPAECDLPGGHPYGPGVVVHLRANVDSTVKRGLSDFLPSGETLEQVGRLLDTMGTVAAVQAKIAWIQKYAAGTPAAAVNTQIQQGKDYTRPKVVPGAGPFSLWPPGKTSDVRGDVPGTVLHVDANKEYLPGPVASPAGWIQVEQAMLRAVGVRWAFPEYFSGDASNGNYSSTKEAGSPFVAAVEGGQGDWADFELGVASAVLMLAAASGRLRAAQVGRLAVHVTAPKVVLADPLAEDQRREIQKRNNALSVTEWIRMDGRDPKVTIANLKKEAEELPDAGGQPADLFGGGGAGAGGGPGPFGEARGDAGGRLAEAHGPPPWPGAVFDAGRHRWVNPDTGETRPAGGRRPRGGLSGKAPKAAGGGTLADGRAVTFVPHASAAHGKTRTLMVDAAKLDAAWAAEDPHYHVGPGAEHQGGKRAAFDRFLASGEPVQAPRVVLGADGRVSFDDGRHRFAALRDAGIDRVAVTVPDYQAKDFAKRFGAAAPEPPRTHLTGPDLEGHAAAAGHPGYAAMLAASTGAPAVGGGEHSRAVHAAREYAQAAGVNRPIAAKLRAGRPLTADEQTKVDAVNALAAAGRLPADTVLYRAVHAGGPPPRPGDVLSDPAPAFTTYRRDFAANVEGDRRLVIHADRGAAAVSGLSAEPGEVVLPSHARLEVLSVDGGTVHARYRAPGRRESVLAENFSGTITDAAGRERHYVDGKQVAGHGHAGAGGSGAGTSPGGAPADAPPLAADLAKVAQQHPDAAADPGTWAKVKDRAARARDAVYGWMVRATPAAWELARAIADTPEDMRRFGFAPTMSGTDANRGDWLQAQTGVGTHLALSVASQVIGSAYTYAKNRLGRKEGADGATAAALAKELAALLAAVGGAFGVEQAPDAEALAAWVKDRLAR